MLVGFIALLQEGDIAEKKKEAFREIIQQGFNDLQFYDDDDNNLRLVKSLEEEFPMINISTIKAFKSRG